jgi:hypothetical protein
MELNTSIYMDIKSRIDEEKEALLGFAVAEISKDFQAILLKYFVPFRPT